MLQGKEAPEWAKKLVSKWIELEERHYGVGKVNMFVLMVDDIGPTGSLIKENTSRPTVRIWPLTEQQARDEIAGKVEPGLFVTMIEEDNYKVIPTPEGLENWTAEQERKHADDSAKSVP
jgi:hypothetical protein